MGREWVALWETVAWTAAAGWGLYYHGRAFGRTAAQLRAWRASGRNGAMEVLGVGARRQAAANTAIAAVALAIGLAALVPAVAATGHLPDALAGLLGPCRRALRFGLAPALVWMLLVLADLGRLRERDLGRVADERWWEGGEDGPELR